MDSGLPPTGLDSKTVTGLAAALGDGEGDGVGLAVAPDGFAATRSTRTPGVPRREVS